MYCKTTHIGFASTEISHSKTHALRSRRDRCASCTIWMTVFSYDSFYFSFSFQSLAPSWLPFSYGRGKGEVSIARKERIEQSKQVTTAIANNSHNWICLTEQMWRSLNICADDRRIIRRSINISNEGILHSIQTQSKFNKPTTSNGEEAKEPLDCMRTSCPVLFVYFGFSVFTMMTFACL